MKVDEVRSVLRTSAGVDSRRRQFAGARLSQSGRQPRLHRTRDRVRASGTSDGNEYIDYIGSWGPLLLGHRFPAVLEALEKRLEIGTSFGAPTEREIDLAELISLTLCRRSRWCAWSIQARKRPCPRTRVARGFTGRDLTIKFDGCYHGHVDSLLVKAGSGIATLGLPDSPGVPKALQRHHIGAAI